MHSDTDTTVEGLDLILSCVETPVSTIWKILSCYANIITNCPCAILEAFRTHQYNEAPSSGRRLLSADYISDLNDALERLSIEGMVVTDAIDAALTHRLHA